MRSRPVARDSTELQLLDPTTLKTVYTAVL